MREIQTSRHRKKAGTRMAMQYAIYYSTMKHEHYLDTILHNSYGAVDGGVIKTYIWN